MVGILPGSYCSPSKTTVVYCFDLHHYTYGWHGGIIMSHEALDHEEYWTAGEDFWIYIAPNELNIW